ncbi:MAG: hypothetical protein RR063_12255 [Anaerovoracaceae bacterium]
MQSVIINGVKHHIHVDLTFERNGKKYILFREYLPNGALGKMEHTTQKSDLVPEEQVDERG